MNKLDCMPNNYAGKHIKYAEIYVNFFEELSYYCLLCKQTYCSHETYLEHLAALHLNNNYNCYLCSDSFGRFQLLFNHMQNSHQQDVQLHVVSDSDKPTSVIEMEKNDKIIDWELTEVQHHDVENLRDKGEDAQSYVETVEIDEIEHNGTGPVIILESITIMDAFDKQTTELIQKAQQIECNPLPSKKKKSGRILKYQCNICGKLYRTTNDLKEHTVVHTKDKQYTCDICKNSFAHIRTLRKHMVIHSSARPFLCSICGMSYKRSDLLTIHMRRHNNDKRYKCNVCGNQFYVKTHLNIHYRIHTGEKPYECSKCTKCFRTSGALQVHFKKLHK